MNNREIIDYILSGKLTEEDVIKKTEKNPFYEDGECVSYLYNDGYYLSDTQIGVASILSFMDSKTNYTVQTLPGEFTECTTTYEIIDKETMHDEILNKNKEKEITDIKRRLVELSAVDVSDVQDVKIEFITASAAKKEKEDMVEEDIIESEVVEESTEEENIEEPVEETETNTDVEENKEVEISKPIFSGLGIKSDDVTAEDTI